jgi:lipopolysaccharide biosynthesis regulator YciM
VKLRTFFYFLAGGSLVPVLAILYQRNREALGQKVFLSRDFSMPIWAAFVFVALAAMAVPILFGLLRDVKQLLDRITRRRALRSREEMERRYVLGIEAILNGREERALEHFRAILERDPSHFEALLKMGDVHREQGRFREAVDLHHRAMRVREEDLRPLFALVEDYERAGDLDAAREMLGRIIQRKPKRALTAYRKLRELLVAEQCWPEAMEVQRKIEEVVGEKGLNAADRKFALGIPYQLASRLASEDRAREALGILGKLLKGAPGFVPAIWKLGKVRLALGETEEAVEVWKRGFERTSAPVFLTTLEDHYLQLEEPDRAIEVFRQLVWKAKRNVIPRFFLGKLYFRLEMLDEALETFLALRSMVSYAPTIHFYVARIYERRGDPVAAAREYGSLLGQVDPLRLEYRCAACSSRYSAWRDFCDTCGEWNSVELDLREQLTLEEMGINPAPVYESASQTDTDEIA